jgi:DNA invertase Pin-like site-specific DNA recombinase
MTVSETIQPHHHQRQALIYLRQSTPQQVLKHAESLKLQYGLRERAGQYGWESDAIHIIDTDLGVTGSSTARRPGFQELVTRVTLGQVGIIFAYDVTRLARNCTDWYQLLDLCGYRQCLVGDQEGVYDPATPNGRLILGLKGLIAELELHTIKTRLLAGLLNKARRGELALSLPVGLVRDLAGRVVFHPDQEVRERLAFVFATFLRVKFVHGVIRDMAAARLLLPRRQRGADDSVIVWRRPTTAAVASLLRNPAYAGSYAYGRTRFGPSVPGGPKRKHPLAPEHWLVMIPDKYPAYIDRVTYAAIQAILHENYLEYQRRRSRGVARAGAALLQGLVYCGHCGRKMTVQYQASARYLCNVHKMQIGGGECQRLSMAPIDACVVQHFWEALTPAALDSYDQALAAFDERRRQVERAHQQQMQRLRYEAQLAEKQYRLVDPENRLVAAELERRWEQALQAVRQAEAEAAAEAAGAAPDSLTAALRQQWEETCPTLRQHWDEGILSNVRKKELLRVLIDKVVLQRTAADRCEVRIVWRGGDWTTVSLALPVVTYAAMADGEALIAEVLRRARVGQSDQQIATELTAAGFHAPLQEGLSAASVYRIRQKHGVYSRKTEFLRRGLRSWMTLGQAVERLGEHTGWAYYLIRQGRLVIQRDREIGLYLVRENKKTLRDLKGLLRGKRFSLTLQPRLP